MQRGKFQGTPSGLQPLADIICCQVDKIVAALLPSGDSCDNPTFVTICNDSIVVDPGAGWQSMFDGLGSQIVTGLEIQTTAIENAIQAACDKIAEGNAEIAEILQGELTVTATQDGVWSVEISNPEIPEESITALSDAISDSLAGLDVNATITNTPLDVNISGADGALTVALDPASLESLEEINVNVNGQPLEVIGTVTVDEITGEVTVDWTGIKDALDGLEVVNDFAELTDWLTDNTLTVSLGNEELNVNFDEVLDLLNSVISEVDQVEELLMEIRDDPTGKTCETPVHTTSCDERTHCSSEEACLQSPASLDFTNIDRCELSVVELNGETLNVNLEAGWTVNEFADAVNAEAPDTFMVVDNEVVLTPLLAFANMRLGCNDESCFFEVNENFENPTQRNTATAGNPGNNILGNTFGDFRTQNGARFNIVRANGVDEPAGVGPFTGATGGQQYVDIAGASDFPVLPFTLTNKGVVDVSAYFANREPESGAYVPWTGRVEILDANTLDVVAFGNEIDFDPSVSELEWFQSTLRTAISAGDYLFRVFVGNSGHFDDVSICLRVLEFSDFQFTSKGAVIPAEIVKCVNDAGDILSHRVYSANGLNEYEQNPNGTYGDDGLVLTTGACVLSGDSDFVEDLEDDNELVVEIGNNIPVPAGFKSVTINNLTGITLVDNAFELGDDRRPDSISFGTDRGNGINEVLPAYALSGGTWQWIAHK